MQRGVIELYSKQISLLNQYFLASKQEAPTALRAAAQTTSQDIKTSNTPQKLELSEIEVEALLDQLPPPAVASAQENQTRLVLTTFLQKIR